MLPKTQQRGCQVVPKCSSLLKVLVVVAIWDWRVLAMRRFHELTLAHAFLTKDVNSIIAMYVKSVLLVAIL